jgi:signal transduction histidine kinase
MKTYILYIVGLVVLMAAMVLSVKAHLLWASIALIVAMLWLCVSLYGRISRLRYAYHETEKENQKLHVKLAEAERQLQYLRQLTENVDTALFVCSTDGRIDWMNHAAKTLPQPLPFREGSNYHQTSEGETTNLSHSDSAPSLTGRAGGESLPSNILQAIDEGAEVVDGCALSTVLLRIDGQRKLVVALKDVSMLMQRQEMEAWQQLIRVLTHEIMNSLTPIISISETLTESLPQGGGQEGAAVINRRCHSLLDFVESYRQLTRIKTPEKTTFPVSELFEHLKALFPKLITNLPSLTGEGQGERLPALLYADRAQIEQVLINLIKNAYESGATEVELSAQQLPSPRRGGGGEAVGSGSGVRLLVRDNGSGMPADVLEHAFIPFYTTKPTGTGIGLSLCRQIILKHGGTIHIESEENKGTTITINI